MREIESVKGMAQKFEEGKKYVFSIDAYKHDEEAIELERAFGFTPTWVDECEGQAVEVVDEKNGKIDIFAIVPEWCEEVESEDEE
jgi:hypothetical protein